jgi:dethiobiotin synthetase
MKPFRAFVVGTDTGVGKTQVACALLSLLADRGVNPAPFKPYETGIAPGEEPSDARALLDAARTDDDLKVVCPHRFRLPLAPGVAAARLGRQPSFAKTLSAFRSFEGRPVIVEAAGGLRVPIDDQRDNIDLVAELGLPTVLVARAGLGTLNHTALSVDALRIRNIPVLAIVLVRSRAERDPSEKDNARVIEARHDIRVLGPVGWIEDIVPRRAAFRRAVLPIVAFS